MICRTFRFLEGLHVFNHLRNPAGHNAHQVIFLGHRLGTVDGVCVVGDFFNGVGFKPGIDESLLYKVH